MSPRQQWAPNYGTHMGPMLLALQATHGPVLELGAGVWSTPMLHQLCAFDGRRLVTVEQVPSWLEQFAVLASDSHELLPYSGSRWQDEYWSVVLVDHQKESRGPDLMRIDAEFIVVHDTERNHRMVYPGLEEYPRLEEVMQTFPHRHDFTTLMPWTTVVSRRRPIPDRWYGL